MHLCANTLYLKTGLGTENACLMVLAGADTAGHKHLNALREGYRESAESWGELPRDYRRRGLNKPACRIADGALGRWATDCRAHDLDHRLTFCRFPEPHWSHLGSTNVIESPFASLRLRSSAAKQFRKTKSGAYLVHQVLLWLSPAWRHLKAAHLCSQVPLPEVRKNRAKAKSRAPRTNVTDAPQSIYTGIDATSAAERKALLCFATDCEPVFDAWGDDLRGQLGQAVRAHLTSQRNAVNHRPEDRMRGICPYRPAGG